MPINGGTNPPPKRNKRIKMSEKNIKYLLSINKFAKITTAILIKTVIIPEIKKSGIKHIHTLHDVQLSTPSGLIIYSKENSLEQRIFLRKWYETLCRWLFGSPDIVISPSKWLLDFYTEKGFFEKSKKDLDINYNKYFQSKKYRFFHKIELNNAYLISYKTYNNDLSKFYEILNKNQGNLMKTIRGIKEKGRGLAVK